ncbi:MAG: hexitol phosphatase HxpB [Candidatus Paceibacterota bacterium]|jgi:sugar-phosphatase
MIQATIFDMDGLLIDSEPTWRKAAQEVLAKIGIVLSDEKGKETMGLRVDHLVEYWYHRQPWIGPSCKEVEQEIEKKVIEAVRANGIPREGIMEALEFVKGKNVKMAIASSSSMEVIHVILEHLKVEKYFSELYSAEFEEYGKPHPAVYLTSAKMLDVPVEHCLAFEDSFNGLLAAKAARMKCICIPDESLRGSAKLGIADIVLPTLAHFNEDVWKQIEE